MISSWQKANGMPKKKRLNIYNHKHLKINKLNKLHTIYHLLKSGNNYPHGELLSTYYSFLQHID